MTEIREVTSPDQWRHCPGKVNPADDASRSLKPPKHSCQHPWWRGPEFLWEAEECWPGVVTYGELPDSDPEVRISANVPPISVETPRIGTPTECSENDNASEDSHAGLSRLIESCSSWFTLQHRVAWIVRFCQWVTDTRIAGSTGPLTLEELNQLGNLRPVLVDGVLWVGGRLQRAVLLSWDEKHPVVLPKRHHVSQLVVRHYHESAAHSGREQTLCELRKMFWIIGGRGLVKKTIRSCIRCRRMNAKPLEQFMGWLPRARLETYHPPFKFTGVDLFGPLTVKWGRGTAKRWVCLFTCLTTRAVYFDGMPSLETDDFIMILRQLIGRRGPPKEIWALTLLEPTES